MTHSYVSVDPDDKHILSATATEAILFGHNDNDVPCILHVSRETYHAAIDDWLDHKADYTRRWDGEFCGVGHICFEDIELLTQAKAWLNSVSFGIIKAPEDPDTDSEIWTHHTAVSTYTAKTFTIDMEHG